MKRIVLLRAGLAALLCSLVPACGDKPAASSGTPAPGKTLKFSAIPDQDKKNLEKFNAIAGFLSKELSVTVEYVPSASYTASVQAFRNEDIQLAWFGGLTGVQARELVPGARAIAQGDSDPEFISYIIAHKDAGLEPGPDFPMGIGELKFTFGDPQSTSGRLMPQYFIEKEAGKPLAEFFTRQPAFSAGHDATCEAVGSGAFQAGVVNYSVYDKRVADGKTDPETVKVIWKTPTYADYNWTAHPGLDTTFGSGFTDKLKAALISMTTKAPALLEVFPRKAMIPAANEDYDGIRAVAESLGFLKE